MLNFAFDLLDFNVLTRAGEVFNAYCTRLLCSLNWEFWVLQSSVKFHCFSIKFIRLFFESWSYFILVVLMILSASFFNIFLWIGFYRPFTFASNSVNLYYKTGLSVKYRFIFNYFIMCFELNCRVFNGLQNKIFVSIKGF